MELNNVLNFNFAWAQGLGSGILVAAIIQWTKSKVAVIR